jgi:hypothetical protein
VPTKKELIDELDFLTDVLSTRWLAGGVLGLSWLVIIQGTDARSFLERYDIIGPIVLALLALLIDFSQYCFGYILNLRLLNYFPGETESILTIPRPLCTGCDASHFMPRSRLLWLPPPG